MRKNRIMKQVEKYIVYKKSLGFQIKIESQQLRKFAEYTLERGYSTSLTADMAFEWAGLKSTYSRWYRARRLELIRNFAKFVHTFDLNTQIPPKNVFGKCHGRTKPYIFTKEETILLMKNASKLHSPDGLRGISTAAIIGLLWSTGMRPQEVCHLLDSDLDIENAVITIRETKFSKNRIVPLKQSVVEALVAYKKKRDKYRKNCDDNHLFLSTNGQEMNLRNLEYAMQVIRLQLPSYSGKWDQRPPRLYDMRHSFACYTLLQWLHAGVDINNKMIYLSTYLGHVKISDTYWYLSGTPELMALSSKIFEDAYSKGDSCHEK
jgi:integrase